MSSSDRVQCIRNTRICPAFVRGIKPSYTLQELPAFVRGKLCDIIPLSPFHVCVFSVYFPSQKKKKKRKRKRKELSPFELQITQS